MGQEEGESLEVKTKIIPELVVNAENIEALLDALSKITFAIQDGEREGFAIGCKWWINDKPIKKSFWQRLFLIGHQTWFSSNGYKYKWRINDKTVIDD